MICKTSTANLVGNATSEVNSRGKYIMQNLKENFGFSDECVIGIGSSLYQESTGWDPTKSNDKSTATGIAQWLEDRQKDIVEYLNKKDKSSFIYGKNNFKKIPLNKQVEGLIWELNSKQKFKTMVTNLEKKRITAKEASDIWTRVFEGVSDLDSHSKYISIARKSFKEGKI